MTISATTITAAYVIAEPLGIITCAALATVVDAVVGTVVATVVGIVVATVVDTVVGCDTAPTKDQLVWSVLGVRAFVAYFTAYVCGA